MNLQNFPAQFLSKCIGAGNEWYLAFLRTLVVPPLAGHILGLEWVKKAVFPRISQIGIGYRHSSLSQHAGDEYFAVKAGDRMPYFLVDGRSIYEFLHDPKWHWLIFSPSIEERAPARSSTPNFEAMEWPLTPQVAAQFGFSACFGVLLRPDNHIALICAHPSPDVPHEYLEALLL